VLSKKRLLNPDTSLAALRVLLGVDYFRSFRPKFCGVVGMQIDTGKIDEAVLALLYLTLHDGERAWKSFDWDAMNRLHEKGFISDPIGKAKSVLLSERGLKESERLFNKYFARA
jgi:hypothetical protein